MLFEHLRADNMNWNELNADLVSSLSNLNQRTCANE